MITFSPANSSSTKINPRPVIGVDFRFAKQDFFFISNNEIFYSYYSYYSKIYSDVIPIMVFPHTLSDVVVDWVHLRIYVASASVGAIYEATITGSSRAIRIAVDKVEDLAIDPYERMNPSAASDELVHHQIWWPSSTLPGELLQHMLDS
ncbi:hypothetical protein J6590_032458 [Homalodisca vitripennis]|nr:hypothetical protein J6590_032458 [Homalodisca vitripennis]